MNSKAFFSSNKTAWIQITYTVGCCFSAVRTSGTSVQHSLYAFCIRAYICLKTWTTTFSVSFLSTFLFTQDHLPGTWQTSHIDKGLHLEDFILLLCHSVYVHKFIIIMQLCCYDMNLHGCNYNILLLHYIMLYYIQICRKYIYWLRQTTTRWHLVRKLALD